MARHFFRLLIVWSSAFGVALFVSAFALPWFFNAYETWRSAPLPYEGALRFLILATAEFLLAGSLVFLLVRGKRAHWLLWWIQLFSYSTLLMVFFGDTTHRLMEEFSWIRYTTAGFLVLAAGFAAAFFFLYRKEGNKNRIIAFFWLLIAGAFLYAGFDETFEMHEAIGRFLQHIGLPSFVTDLVTVSYALVTLFFLCIFFRIFRAEYAERHRFFLTVFALGGITYFFSTMLDTVDIFMGEKLRVLANTLAIDPSFVFSDAWSIIWAPKNFFNGLEEVFEHTAASLFFSALLILFLEKRMQWIRGVAMSTPRRRVLAFSIMVFFLLFFVSSLMLSAPYVFARIPLVGARGISVATRIAGYFDGLSHTDDLFYHPVWGVLVANEGKGNIYQWKDGLWGMVPDPKKALRDTDSVTADAGSIYVSDGSQGTIFRTDGKGKWEALWTTSDGLKHPEGIVVVDGALYVIDESERSMTKLVRGEKPEVWRPQHPDWRAPEGIAYDARRKVFLVADDESGVVFEVTFGVSLTPLAQLSHPEDITVANDGRIFVTDNGWGAVFAIAFGKNPEKIAQFRRSYRDLQGIALDDDGYLYVVTADGFDRVSFMPSMLFRITNQE